MLTTLSTPYTDTRAGDLAWVLGREPLPALAVRELELDGAAVQLRLLGASHQVLLEEDGGSCSETVACMQGSSTPLPLGVSKRVGVWEYEFAAHVEKLAPASFAGRAQELLALVSDHPNGLAGTFPGSPDAFTALLVRRQSGQVHWRTWHSYPQEGTLVSTRTRVGVPVRASAPLPESGRGVTAHTVLPAGVRASRRPAPA
ncbi:Protein of unknown function DUF2617 [Streptomyces sp. WMMB 714]|uniref:DUF2617 family protein n=1 Tax=Streptomyces sp. WMMB 714 TaxID=1286822 RepID=UPI0008239CC6|nr:DUF2617 family protein [Streptomyces sp. WMMB 714]SCK25086.1 Protein of unknown function DUF2617 [Streptomyces sp. WMMB 714]